MTDCIEWKKHKTRNWHRDVGDWATTLYESAKLCNELNKCCARPCEGIPATQIELPRKDAGVELSLLAGHKLSSEGPRCFVWDVIHSSQLYRLHYMSNDTKGWSWQQLICLGVWRAMVHNLRMCVFYLCCFWSERAQIIHISCKNYKRNIWLAKSSECKWCKIHATQSSGIASSIDMPCKLRWSWHSWQLAAQLRTRKMSTQWGRDNMVAIFQTTFSNGFSWMKMYEFRLTFHWSLFQGVELTIFQHWFR